MNWSWSLKARDFPEIEEILSATAVAVQVPPKGKDFFGVST
jgi:hypothetical protein